MAKVPSLSTVLALALPLLCACAGPLAATTGASRRLMQSPLPAVTAPLPSAFAPLPAVTSAPVTLPPVATPLTSAPGTLAPVATPQTSAPVTLPPIATPLTSAPLTLPPVATPLTSAPVTLPPVATPLTSAPVTLPPVATPLPSTLFPTFPPGPVTWTARFDTNIVGSDLLGGQFTAPGVTPSPACFGVDFVPPLNAPLVNPLTQCESLCATWQTVVPGAPACVAFVSVKVATAATAPAKNCCFLKSAATGAVATTGFDLYVRNVI